jgi:hypothetical protein
MRIKIFLLLSLLSFALHAQKIHGVVSSSKKSHAVTVSGLERFSIDQIHADVGSGIFVSNLAIHNGKLRPDIEDNPYCMFKTTYGGFDWLEFYVNPTAESSYIPTINGYAYHFRSEFSRYPWEIKYALGTEIWIGVSYVIPSDVTAWVSGPISILQVKGSSNGGDAPPAIQLELAYPGQLNSSTIYRKTPLGGEVMMINEARGIRWTPPSSAVRLIPGGRLDVVMQILFEDDDTGFVRFWLNGTRYEFPGYTTGGDTYPAGDYGVTVNSTYAGVGLRGDNPKIGLYCHSNKITTGSAGPSDDVQTNITAGHTYMRLLITNFNMVTRTPSDPDYLSNNAYNAVDTSTYNE